MESFNSVCISGNLASDPELKGQDRSSVLSFRVAVNDRRKNQAGEWEDVPNFIPCVMFGKRAESISNMIHKGDRVQIIGSLRYSSWDSEGGKRSKIEVNVRQLEFSPRKAQEASQEVADEDFPF